MEGVLEMAPFHRRDRGKEMNDFDERLVRTAKKGGEEEGNKS